MQLVFFHGLESGPHGSKYQRLQARWPQIVAPDCQGVRDPWERIERVELALADFDEPLVIVGSSFGGLIASHFAERHPSRVAALVLCAPALHVPEPWMPKRAPVPTVIIHGVDDAVVPVQASRRWAERFDLQLIEVADDHRLARSHEEMTDAVARIVE
ncbi:MAG: alpha/beta hydrolase [Myxococcales bacterium]|nr:alpha/beta hydrolase [Myxococcales bacterium]